MINFSQQGECCVISGRLTQTEVAQLWPKRQQLFTDTTQVIDLSTLEYVDSAGVALLLALIRLNDSNNKGKSEFRKLANPSEQLKQMIELYDLDTFFTQI